MRIPTPEDLPDLLQLRERHSRIAVPVGLLLLVALTFIRFQLDSLLGQGGLPFLLFVLAVLGASWLGGWIPGVVVTAAGAVTGLYFFLGVRGQWLPILPDDMMRTGIFVVVGLIVSAMCEALIRARERVESQARELQTEMRARQGRERERREQEHRKDEFLAVLAHELRNPLTPIVNSAALLHARKLADPVVERAAQLIDRHAKHMVRLIDDLLDVARIERGTFELRRECVDIERILEAAGEHCRPSMIDKRQRFEIRRPPYPVRLEADYLRLVQLLTNLLNNASAYTPEGGSIECEAKVVDNHLHLMVRDDGQGLASGDSERIFAIFERGASNRTGNGLGIGLALVRQIAEMHGGDVHATSDGDGLGSTFTVRIPGVSAQTPLAESEPAAPESTGRGQRLRILVVDDQADLLESVVAVLQLLGHEVAAAHSGEQALTRMRTDRPDLVLLDVGMPDMNGYEVARRASLEPWRRATTLVAMTGWGRDEDRERARDAGFDRHVVKPLDFDRLQELLATFAATTAQPS